ncbi:MAG: P27 family phage terminase small subunit [Clostridiales bacterium]|nr:P27 family phage terminase small subunit [Clostridiales bacterium]
MGQRGPKQGSGGRPKKALADKIVEGNAGHRPLTVIDFGDKAADLEGQDMPKPSEYLSAPQQDGSKLCAAEIYENTWNWLSERGCSALVSPQLIERFAMASARWIQCENITSKLGFLSKHPTTGAAIQSPYVAIGDKYLTQANRLWSEIYQIVRENCTSEYGGAGQQEDMMEQMLSRKKGSF